MYAFADTNSIELRAVSPEPPPPFVPGPVTNLKITLVTHIDQSPSISLSWCRPENCTSNVNIKEYYIKVFTTLTSGDSLNSSTNGDHVYKLKTFTTPGSVTKLAVTRKDGLIPLVLYTIEVKAKSQEETIGKEVQDSIYIRKRLSMINDITPRLVFRHARLGTQLVALPFAILYKLKVPKQTLHGVGFPRFGIGCRE